MTPLNKLFDSDKLQSPFDVAGIIRKVISIEVASAKKKKVQLILADPTLNLEVQAKLTIVTEEEEAVKEWQVVVIKNVLALKSSEGTVTLKSTYTTDIVTQFDEGDPTFTSLNVCINALRNCSSLDFVSLSRTDYYPRTIK